MQLKEVACIVAWAHFHNAANRKILLSQKNSGVPVAKCKRNANGCQFLLGKIILCLANFCAYRLYEFCAYRLYEIGLVDLEVAGSNPTLVNISLLKQKLGKNNPVIKGTEHVW